MKETKETTVASKYLEYFQKAKPDLQLVGDVLLVERIPAAEIKTASGLIIADATKMQASAIGGDRPHWAIVLAVGEGFYDDATGEAVPLDVKPGDVVLVGQMSVRYFGTLEVIQDSIQLNITYQPDTIGVTRESEILIKKPAQPGVPGPAKKEADDKQLSFEFEASR